MIKYTLKCDHGHTFDSWFKSAGAFDVLCSAGHMECPNCGSTTIKKAMMAPQVKAAQTANTPDHKIKALKTHIEKNADYVGGDFAQQARAMHSGDAPERAIWGEARPAEAKALLAEGVPVLPLPFVPKSKIN